MRLWAPTWCPSGGATSRVWVPRATAIYLNGVFGGVTLDSHTDPGQLLANIGGYWTGFVASAQKVICISSGLTEPGRLDSSAIHMPVSLPPTPHFPIAAASFAPLPPTLGTIRPLSRPISVI